jgi:hypothetical protein
MSKFAIRLGVTGGILGAVAGLIELTVGAQIRPWIGNKENPAVLGVVTLLLSGLALGATLSARNAKTPTNDARLAIFLGVWLPAMICFTTVGRLWYLPGLLLTVATLLLARQYWFGAEPAGLARTAASIGRADRLVAVAGSLLILVSVGLGLSRSSLGLYQSEIQVEAARIRVEVGPMDFVRLTNLSSDPATVQRIEASRVMVVYILLILGGALALVASLTASRLFLGAGGGIAFAGLTLFLIWLPTILAEAGPAAVLGVFPSLVRSLNWGWYLPIIGAGLILAVSLSRSQPGKNASLTTYT